MYHFPLKFSLCLSLYCLCLNGFLNAQNKKDSEDAFFLKSIYDEALQNDQDYSWLSHLSQSIGARLSGSPQAAAAVEYTKQMLDTLGLDTVWLQPCTVPHWERGAPELAKVINNEKIGDLQLKVLALGNSVGTGPLGITGEVVEVQQLDDLALFDEGFLEGKIIFFNRPMDPTQFNTFSAYGGAVDQRVWGASRASKYGAIGVLVRSMTNRLDDVPHTGSLAYEDGVIPIPAFGLSTNDSELLSQLIKNSTVRVFMRKQFAHALSKNLL